MNRGINIYSNEVYINDEETDISEKQDYNSSYFWKICNYVNQKFRNIGTFIDRNDVNDRELLNESREQGLEYDND